MQVFLGGRLSHLSLPCRCEQEPCLHCWEVPRAAPPAPCAVLGPRPPAPPPQSAARPATGAMEHGQDPVPPWGTSRGTGAGGEAAPGRSRGRCPRDGRWLVLCVSPGAGAAGGVGTRRPLLHSAFQRLSFSSWAMRTSRPPLAQSILRLPVEGGTLLWASRCVGAVRTDVSMGRVPAGVECCLWAGPGGCVW